MIETVVSNDYQRPEVPNYDISFDQNDYAKLFSRKIDSSPDFLALQLSERDKYTRLQLRTEIGERLHVNLSTTFFDEREGQFWGRRMHEPFIDVIKRGRDKRRELGMKIGVYDDFAREDAEVEGFQKAEDAIKEGKMAVIISPPGHAYLKNFYDIGFRNQEGEVEFRRYTSGLDIAEYAQKTKILDPNSNFTAVSTDADYLSRPLIVDSNLFRTPEDVHAFLHTSHSFMSKNEFDQIMQDEGLALAIEIYISDLHQNPFATERLKKDYKGILNRADYLKKLYGGAQTDSFASDVSSIRSWGDREPEKIAGGCGTSGADSPWSVADFGMQDSKGKLSFNCPRCGVENFRPYEGFVESCWNCHTRDVACDPKSKEESLEEEKAA